jgi:ABC-type transport system involved in cytochrome bd biosynthesis fused ATPase/permease subunit
MHIVALAWIYVVLMMSITETSVVAGIAIFLLYGILPLSIILYLTGTRQRNRRRIEREKLLQHASNERETAAFEQEGSGQ